MLHSLQVLVAPAIAERLTLVINHVLGGEAVATARLRPYVGRSLALTLAGWPSLLPAPPPLAWLVTPAGMLEWCGADGAAAHDLALKIDAANPALLFARMVAGETPEVQIEGDEQFAGDVNWLLQNLRWDAAADLERLFGPVVAPQLLRIGSAIAGGLRAAIKGAATIAERLRPRGP
jgi:ubiquinone biosynthesis accessory factor UbiJ